ncbi:flagellar basal body P-ring formation chaperone FlgA [Seleniivibrio woodruffii]|uniref:Flagella basal body P-ring formation protein FlgA n=1 Tax=Seleniivibrio woodruffii TaxID=1078050 RepID=A0A4R1KCP2_9BACT|nr:flagellar basal body P-ring formation chaperone FlgA [Seleniivibrio woodruffii]TCK62316.1 flagella basal body P-ring formation protein FlgA [Seleniivibrio woodruffii]TVZ34567.1 flagella basal body P-ring formation protein FlgA [Seleniivibrio woodruffii]
MVRLLFLFSAMVIFSGFTYIGNEIVIEKDCIAVSDVFEGTDIEEDVVCGLDYGQVKIINRLMSQTLISKYGLKGEQPREMIFKRKGVLLTAERLKADMKNLLTIMYPEMEIEIDAIRMGRAYYLPENMQYSIDIPGNRFGDISVTLDNGVRKYTYSVSITAYAMSYVAVKQIERGEPLTDENVKLKKVDLSRARGGLLHGIDGYFARVTIAAGRIVTENLADRRPDAAKGSPVFLMNDEKDEPKNMTGTLLEDAYLNKKVKVLNIQSGMILTGTYMQNRRVLLEKQ